MIGPAPEQKDNIITPPQRGKAKGCLAAFLIIVGLLGIVTMLFFLWAGETGKVTRTPEDFAGSVEQ